LKAEERRRVVHDLPARRVMQFVGILMVLEHSLGQQTEEGEFARDDEEERELLTNCGFSLGSKSLRKVLMNGVHS
jgi:hypothetical protein